MLSLLPNELFFGSDSPEIRPEFLCTRFPKNAEIHVSPARAISRSLGVENELTSKFWPGIDFKYFSPYEFPIRKRAEICPQSYLYVFNKEDIYNFNPSPFSVGRVIYLVLSGNGVMTSSAGIVEFMGWIEPLAKAVSSDKELIRVQKGDVRSWEEMGSKILPRLTEFQKKSVIVFSGGSICIPHEIPVSKVYVFNKIEDNGLFLKDGSNYSQVAKLIWERND